MYAFRHAVDAGVDLTPVGQQHAALYPTMTESGRSLVLQLHVGALQYRKTPVQRHLQSRRICTGALGAGSAVAPNMALGNANELYIPC